MKHQLEQNIECSYKKRNWPSDLSGSDILALYKTSEDAYLRNSLIDECA